MCSELARKKKKTNFSAGADLAGNTIIANLVTLQVF
jgi:hypothetical protein